MRVNIREYEEKDLSAMIDIWNEVVEAGVAFPQTEPLTLGEGAGFFASQSFTAVAELDGEIAGLYILHPNNVGRCGHQANASYALKESLRGNKVGEALMANSLQKGRELGFRLMQFNAVVHSNAPAIHLYEKLGFVRIGVVPGGFFLKNGNYEDIVLFYHAL